jgi:hypothetical protein
MHAPPDWSSLSDHAAILDHDEPDDNGIHHPFDVEKGRCSCMSAFSHEIDNTFHAACHSPKCALLEITISAPQRGNNIIARGGATRSGAEPLVSWPPLQTSPVRVK